MTPFAREVQAKVAKLLVSSFFGKSGLESQRGVVLPCNMNAGFTDSEYLDPQDADYAEMGTVTIN